MISTQEDLCLFKRKHGADSQGYLMFQIQIHFVLLSPLLSTSQLPSSRTMTPTLHACLHNNLSYTSQLLRLINYHDHHRLRRDSRVYIQETSERVDQCLGFTFDRTYCNSLLSFLKLPLKSHLLSPAIVLLLPSLTSSTESPVYLHWLSYEATC